MTKFFIVLYALVLSPLVFAETGSFRGDLNGTWNCATLGEIHIAHGVIYQEGKPIARLAISAIGGPYRGVAPITNQPNGLFILGHACYKN